MLPLSWPVHVLNAELFSFPTVRSQLREIEIIIGARLEVAEAPAEEGAVPVTEDEKETLLQMQQILYSTEVSFRSTNRAPVPPPQGFVCVPIAC